VAESTLPPLRRALTDNPANSFTLPSDYYLSAEIFEREKQQIFYRSWQYVAPVSMLIEPGAYTTLRICDENVFVIRADNGELRAFYNVCRHRAHELLEGSGKLQNLIVCPYHAWSYNSQGELLRAPQSEHRAAFDNKDFCLHEVRLEIFCGCVFVNLDDRCASLQSLAGDLEQDIRRHLPYFDDLGPPRQKQQAVTAMQAGWKVVVDNYVECYHCRPAHPDFASIIDMNEYQVDVFDYWSRQLGPRIRVDNSAYPLDCEGGFRKSVFWYLWPNTTFNVMPGPASLGIFAVRPLGLGSSAFDGHSLGVGAEVYQPRADYVSDTLAPEDIDICESVQRGLRSRSYDQGAYMVNPDHSGEGEHALHHFHRLLLSALAAD